MKCDGNPKNKILVWVIHIWIIISDRYFLTNIYNLGPFFVILF